MSDPEGIYWQRQMVCDMNQAGGGKLGWNHPGFTDPNTHEPLTLGEMFDRHALTMLVIDEVEERS
jgi:hypothetical protein